MKFKVGDKVKFINLPENWSKEEQDYFKDKTGTITRIPSQSGAFDCNVDVPPFNDDSQTSAWFFDELELVTE